MNTIIAVSFEVGLRGGNIVREIDDHYLSVLRETVTGNNTDHVEFPVTYNSETASTSLKSPFHCSQEKPITSASSNISIRMNILP